MMQHGHFGGQNPPIDAVPSWLRETLFTVGCRFFGAPSVDGENSTLFQREPASRLGNVKSDSNVIANSPRNTSGFLSYIAQVTVIVALF